MGSDQNDAALSASSLFNVDGMVILVTGGGSGIGLMITKALAKNGAAKVYIAGRRLDKLEEAAAAVGPNVVPVQCDVTSKDDLQAAASRVASETGFLNLLVCNSGIGGPQVAPLTADTTLGEWADANMALDLDAYLQTFAINTAAVWFTTMAFLKLLGKGNERGNARQTSQVVVTSSIGGSNKKAPGGWPYGQSKAAATHAVKQLSVALPQWDIRANGIAPGLFPSEMSEPIIKRFAAANPGGEPGAVPREMVPLGRTGDDLDMGGTILYLASRAGAYCNGEVMIVDGGRLGLFPSTV